MNRPFMPQRRVLVVDDDLDALHLVDRILSREGCAVTCVSDPRQVLLDPPTDPFDLALLDVMMPGIDGLELCLVLRRHYGDDLRICMMTAAHDEEALRIAEQFGADGYLLKPLRPAVLVPEPPRAPRRTSPSRPGKRVLVVDDDPDVLAWCGEVFRRAGADVDAVSDPAALAARLPGCSYDLVLMDVFMPVFGGIALIRRFMKDVRNVTSRFYTISATDGAALRGAALGAGADGHLPKPLRARQVLSLLEDAGSTPLDAEMA
jgi:two-component system, sensor histidine kinase and response regulator